MKLTIDFFNEIVKIKTFFIHNKISNNEIVNKINIGYKNS